MNRFSFPASGRTGLIVAGIAVLLGCDPRAKPISAPPDVVPLLVQVVPDSTRLAPGETLRFRALDTDAVPVAVEWTSDGGVITDAGFFTAPAAPGTYHIVASSPDAADTAVVVIDAPPPPPGDPVLKVQVSPRTVTLYPGETAAFAASVVDSNGQPQSVPLAWSTDGGAVSSSGTFVAGDRIGSFGVIVSCTGGADTAWVSIVPPPVGAGHEPAGYVQFLGSPFDQLPADAGTEIGTWYRYPVSDPDLTIQSVQSAPVSPPSVVQIRFPKGQKAGVGSVDFGGWDAAGTGAAGQKSKVYLSQWIRILGSDYENQSSGTKVGFIAYGRSPSQGANEGFFFLDNGTGVQRVQSSFKLQFRQQSSPQPDGTISRNLLQNVNSTALMTAGTWHHWEAVLELNTMGQANGIFRMWIDGIKIMDYSDVVYIVPSQQNGFFLYKWNPTWGGSGGSRTRDDYIQIDDIYMSGQP